jgi:hypothetical protein
MTDLVLVPFGSGEFLAFTPVALAQARDRAREILGEGWAGDRAAADTTQSPGSLHTAEEMEKRTKARLHGFSKQRGRVRYRITSSGDMSDSISGRCLPARGFGRG